MSSTFVKLKNKFRFIEPHSQLNTTGTKPLLHGNIHHATAVFLFPFLSLADIAFEEFGFFKDMYKLPELHIRQLVIMDTQPLAAKRRLFFKRASLEICNILCFFPTWGFPFLEFVVRLSCMIMSWYILYDKE